MTCLCHTTGHQCEQGRVCPVRSHMELHASDRPLIEPEQAEFGALIFVCALGLFLLPFVYAFLWWMGVRLELLF